MDFSHSPNSGTFPASVYRMLPWICKWAFECFMPPALARDSYGSGSGRPVRSTPSGQHALARESALHLHLVSATVSGSRSFPRFSLFSLSVSVLFWAQQKGNTWHKLDDTSSRSATRKCPKYTMYIQGPVTQFLRALSQLQLQLQAQFHYEHAHSGTHKYSHTHTHSHSFVCEWTLAKNAFGIFNVIYLYHFWLVNNITGVETQLHLFVRYVISCLWVL